MATSAIHDAMLTYVPTFAHHFAPMNATVAQNTLYGGISLPSLNWLERMWASYYIYMGNPVVATGVMSFVLHEVR
jgi:methylsterol monooxygenase